MKKLVGIIVALMSFNQFAYAAPVTIDFEGFPSSSSFVSGVEDGFNITAVGSGEATSPNGFGSDGLGGTVGIGISTNSGTSHPIFQFELSTSGLFEFTSLDLIDILDFGVPDITVTGFNSSTLVGTDIFSAPSAYQTFTSTNLAGIKIDLLLIDFGTTLLTPAVVDNVLLDAPLPSVPAPAAIWLFFSGLIGLARVKKNSHGQLSFASK